MKSRNRTWLLETDPSETVFGEEESANDDFGEGLVDSDNAGQETAPMTGPTSTTPFDGLFHASFFGRAALLLLASKFSAAIELSGGGEDEAEATFEEDKLSVDSDIEVSGGGGGGDGDEGECWTAAEPDSGSPRTTWAHGDGKFFRRNWGLERPSPEYPEPRGEWWLEVESAVIAIQSRVFRLKTESQDFNLNNRTH